MPRRHFFVPFLAFLSILLLISACNQSSGGARHSPGTGTLNVRLTDAPIDLSNVQSVNVTLTGVIVYPEDDDVEFEVPEVGADMEQEAQTRPISLLSHPATFDLLTLTGGVSTLLASGEVPAGEYSRIRLEISSAEIVYLDATTAPLKVESNKVDVPIQFDLSVNEDASVTLDFDAAASVQVNETASGTLILRPVVTVKETD
ncbi:MAG: DUF4382 domain-containing protein [Acidobacteria bacterium]|nr:DUF4382 domain-containing protein [Acidobacteriota bacterium]